jgi:hypothetical protein
VRSLISPGLIIIPPLLFSLVQSGHKTLLEIPTCRAIAFSTRSFRILPVTILETTDTGAWTRAASSLVESPRDSISTRRKNSRGEGLDFAAGIGLLSELVERVFILGG